jgi:hypothetical protein
MGDEGTPPGPPRFPPVDEPPPPPGWPPPGAGNGYPPPHGYGGPSGPSGYPSGPGGHWLHPLDVGRAFGSSWRLFRLRWRPMLGAMLAITVPVALVQALVQGYVVGPALETWTDQYLAAIRSGNVTSVPLPPPIISLTYVVALIAGILGFIANAAVIHIVDANYRGGSATATEGLRAAFGRVMTLLGIYLALIGIFIAVAIIGALIITILVVLGAVIGDVGLTVLLSLIGVIGLIAAVIFFALRWSLAPQAAMIEGVGALKALGRSWRLITGSTWRLLGYFLLIGLVLFGFIIVGSIVAALVGSLFGSPVRVGSALATMGPLATTVSALLSAVLFALVTPWWVTLLTLFYYDLRWRRGEPLAGAATAPAVPA